MKRRYVFIGIFGVAVAFFAMQEKPTMIEAAIDGDFVLLRSKFGVNRVLLRKIDLTSRGRGNEIVNFAGSRIVSAFGNVPFERGYKVSEEYDDATPLRFNGTYIGANHGAAFAVRVSADGQLPLNSRWTDADGTSFRVIASDTRSTTFISDEIGNPGSWRFKTSIKGRLSAINSERSIVVGRQTLSQVFPSVRRLSVSVDTGSDFKLGTELREVPKVGISEVYEILSPTSASEPVAKVSVRYLFSGSDTRVETTIEAYRVLRDFSMAGTQASPINYNNTNLLQKVGSGEWVDITHMNGNIRIPGKQASQKISWSSFEFGQTVSVESVTINGNTVKPAALVEVSAARKQYPLALVAGVEGFDGVLQAGDRVSVVAHRSYWLGTEPLE